MRLFARDGSRIHLLANELARTKFPRYSDAPSLFTTRQFHAFSEKTSCVVAEKRFSRAGMEDSCLKLNNNVAAARKRDRGGSLFWDGNRARGKLIKDKFEILVDGIYKAHTLAPAKPVDLPMLLSCDALSRSNP
jgi:hypothetical protein